MDTSKAEKMPGVAYVLTYKNAVKPSGPHPAGFRAVPEAFPLELNLQGEVVAIVAAETEDLAHDAVDAIEVEYDVLPFASTLKDAMAPDAPDLREGKGQSAAPAELTRRTFRRPRGRTTGATWNRDSPKLR